MASYDIFSQPQGANISISLFGDARSAGINAGNALPTTTTSIVRGITQGVDKGLQVASEIQNLQLRQNQIDNLPITDQIRLQQLENAQQAGELNELKLKEATQLQDLSIRHDKAKLEAGTTKLERDKRLGEKRDLFEEQFSSVDPNTQAQMLMSGQFNDVFGYDKNLYQATINSVATNPNNGLSEIERNNLLAISRKTGARSEFEKTQAQYDKAYRDNNAVLQEKESGVLGDLARQTGLSQQDSLRHGEWVERDSWIKNPQNGKVERNPNFTRQPESPIWDFKYTDPRNGKTSVITQGLPDNRKQLFDKQQASESLASGRDLRAQESLIDAETSKINKPQFQSGVNVPLSSTRSYIESEAKSTLDITDNTLSKITPSLGRFYTALEKQVKEPATDRRFEALQFREKVVANLSRKVSDSQYEENKLIREQYTPAEVVKYNKEVFNRLRASRSFAEYNDDELRAAYAPWFMGSPQDLYYNTQKDVLTKQIQTLTNKYMEAAQRSVGSTYNWQSDKNSVVQGLLNR